MLSIIARLLENMQCSASVKNSLEKRKNGLRVYQKSPSLCEQVILAWHKPHFSEQIASHWSPTTVDSCFMRVFSGKAVYRTQACKETMANWCSLLRASLRPLDAFYVREACFLLFTKSCSPRVDNNPEQIWLSADVRATRRAHGDDTHYCLGSQQK